MGNFYLSEEKRLEIESRCKPLIENFKELFVAKKPNKDYDYIVDIYGRWIKSSFYFCEKYQNDNRLDDKEFEVKFAKLSYKPFGNQDLFDLFYFKSNDTWTSIEAGLPLDTCLKLIEDLPNLHP